MINLRNVPYVGSLHRVAGVQLDAETLAWAARVVANGGATPSNNTLSATSTFVETCKTANIWTKIFAVNLAAPDSLIATTTPLLKSTGNDPWTNHNFVSGDLTVNGLLGNGSSKFLDTGIILNTTGQVNSSSGYFVYVSVDDATTQQSEFGVYGPQTNSFCGLYTHYSTTLTFGGCFRFDTGKVIWTAPTTPAGFYSLQRTGATTLNIYFANSGQAHSSLASDSSTPIGAPENTFPMFCSAANSVGTAVDFSKKRVSAWGITAGLSAAEDLSLFNALQAVRTAYGGGFV